VSAPDRLGSVHGRWLLTIRTEADGTLTYVAHRPVGWTGPGDPFEELTAPSRRALLAALACRGHREPTP
jgi:hypothetical protein